jgi:hypothetical protein
MAARGVTRPSRCKLRAVKLVLLCLLIACEKTDDVVALRQQTAELGSSAQAHVEALDARMQALVKRGLKLTRRLPGTDDAGKLVRDASVDLAKVHAELAELTRGAAAATTEVELERVVGRYRALEVGSGGEVPPLLGLDADGTALSTAESWVTHAEAEMRDGSAVPVSQ